MSLYPWSIFPVYLSFMNYFTHRAINAVCNLQRMKRGFDYVTWAILAAAPLVPFSPNAFLFIVITSCILAIIRPNPASAAAKLIDKHYNLKDRTLTAVALLEHTNRTPMEQLQIEDADTHLMFVRPQEVIPIRRKKFFFALVASPFIMIAVDYCLSFSSTQSKESVSVMTAESVLPAETATMLEDMIAKTDEIVREHVNEQSLKKLSEQLEALMDKLVTVKMDAKESLMTLSEMEEAIQSAMDSLQLETMEESLQDLAKTLELAEKTEPIGKALEKGNFAQAAWELRKLDAETLESLSKPEQKAMAEQMQSLSDDAEKRSQQSLQEAAQKMSDALKNEDGDLGKAATDELANEVEKHGVRKEIAKNLAQQQMLLAMMKAEGGQGNMSGGKGTDKSETSSKTWGSGAAGNPNAGQETNLQGQRQQQKLTGAMGEQGDSETETIDSHEMSEATSQREYREQYQQYQKISEAVLDSEPIPLGQRQVIRRYFESIRPSSE